MIPAFSNYAGLWALLAIPAIVAAHFLQQRSRTLRTSTLFLLEALAPESRGGRKFDRFRFSKAFWLQIASVILATWVLVQPRWVRSESAQVVVAVLDDSVSMRAFHDEAVRAVERMFSENERRAARTDWIVMTSDPRRPALYRGADKAAALAAAKAWTPSSGTHDCAQAVRLARSLAGGSGAAWFFTDRRGRAPADQPAVGVGRPLANAGFAGARVFRREGKQWAWRALVRNYSDVPLAREWWLESGGRKSPRQRVEIAPGGLMELSAQFPEGADACELVLEPDDFAADDRLPLVKPQAKRLTVSAEMNGETAREYFRKLAGSIEGVEIISRSLGALRFAELGAGVVSPKGGAIFVVRTGPGAQRAVQTAPVVAERHALTDGLNWQGFVGTGAAGLKRAEGAEVLLWQNGEALAWVAPDAGGAAAGRQLFLNFDWETGNAARLPSVLLLVRRFVEEMQDAQPGGYAANFDAGAPVAIGGPRLGAGVNVREPVSVETQSGTRELGDSEVPVLRAPREPGFFTVKRGGATLVRGAAQFADARQGDFRAAESFVSGAPAAAGRAMWMRNSHPDPLANAWLLLIGAMLVWSWWPKREGGAIRGRLAQISSNVKGAR